MEPLVMVFITAENLEQARTISQALLEARLVACANVVKSIESHYLWKGNLESADETLIIIKTVAGRLRAVQEIVKTLHSYEVFELIAIPVIDGNPDYLQWIRDEVSGE